MTPNNNPGAVSNDLLPLDDGWSDAKEVELPLQPRPCEGKDCLNMFTPTWPIQRRCPRCKREKRPYKDPTSPF